MLRTDHGPNLMFRRIFEELMMPFYLLFDFLYHLRVPIFAFGGFVLIAACGVATVEYASGAISVVCFTCALIFYFACLDYFCPDTLPPDELLRGPQELQYETARSIANSQRHPHDNGIQWGGVRIPSSAAVTHFCVVGAIGSGKTLTIRMIMDSVLGTIGQGHDSRALVYDAKQDMLPLLKAICPHADVLTLNPFDNRCVGWDMAKDITSPAVADHIASVLIPPGNESQPFSLMHPGIY